MSLYIFYVLKYFLQIVKTSKYLTKLEKDIHVIIKQKKGYVLENQHLDPPSTIIHHKPPMISHALAYICSKGSFVDLFSEGSRRGRDLLS